MTVEAVLGSRSPFDARIHAARGQKSQIDTASAYRDLLGERSEVSDSHQNCGKVQDPYSLRCQPQVMGACLTQFRQAAEVLVVEANAVSDNQSDGDGRESSCTAAQLRNVREQRVPDRPQAPRPSSLLRAVDR
ncbi:aromatic amino acid lyase [Pseudomonas fluorescens]|nr:aromatic amino acid lyase [Pseudomonas fluorescens]MBD8780960.1 aromatic amino acid lyase [Pseudomonas fluorescens]MBD8796836.1 aromatic amino acid lyase [Pseudomonas fluorescens]